MSRYTFRCDDDPNPLMLSTQLKPVETMKKDKRYLVLARHSEDPDSHKIWAVVEWDNHHQEWDSFGYSFADKTGCFPIEGWILELPDL